MSSITERKQVESGQRLITVTIKHIFTLTRGWTRCFEGQEKPMIHKNTDVLSDLKCIFNNDEHGVNKSKVSVPCWESN